jgi:glycosyltransferase involved in cell wall biosynthesis
LLDLSIVVGCYNAGNKLEGRLLELSTYLKTLGCTHELIVVEDGSTDDSYACLKSLATIVPELVVLRNERNRGKGFSICRGVDYASGRAILFTDVDLAYSFENIATALECLRLGHPIVVGNRRLPESIYTVNNTLVKYIYRRHLLGMAFNLLVRLLFGLDIRDTQSGLKGFDNAVAKRVFPGIRNSGFLFDIEIFIIAKELGLPVQEIAVHVTYEDDESTATQLGAFFSLLPQLGQIKQRQLKREYSEERFERLGARHLGESIDKVGTTSPAPTDSSRLA